jgi:glycosyltransferase involved in cell wall biosynthesis
VQTTSYHIAIDASRTTAARMTGTERYALELIRAMIAYNTRHHLTLFFRDTPPDDLFEVDDNVTLRVIPFRRLWTHIRFAQAIWQGKPDITFVPAHTLPLWTRGLAAVTVHDLGYRYFPEAHPPAQRAYLNWSTRHSARRADLVLADSKATANDLRKFYKVDGGKINVVYPGVNRPEYTETDVIAKYNLDERYFLFIGTLQPRKNIETIVKAYRAYRERTKEPADLVLAGNKGWLYDDRWTVGVPGVHLPGFIDEADKGNLYANAHALVFPTLYEGFGFPVIEAMMCGLPVLTSDTSSLPELADDAAILVDPTDTAAIARAMLRVDTDYDLREELRDNGYKRARKFSWDKAAIRTLAALEATVKKARDA